MQITDEDITAWLDGELSEAKSREIEQRVEADAALAARVAFLKLDLAHLRSAFDSPAALAPPPPALITHRSARRRGLFLGTALAASIALAFGLGVMMTGPPTIGDWKTEVAHYQILYVPETLQNLIPDQEQLQNEFARAEANLGWALNKENLGQIEGLTLRRVQVLGFRGKPLIQVAYTDSDDTPIAFCIMVNDSGETLEPSAGTLLGLGSEAWQDAQGRYLVIGGNDLSKITGYAAQIRRQASSI